jgi:hypothetical protein
MSRRAGLGRAHLDDGRDRNVEQLSAGANTINATVKSLPLDS